MLLPLSLLVPFLIGNVSATSEVTASDRARAFSDCHALATFETESVIDQRVFWTFRKSSADCSENLSDQIIVRIPPGQYNEKLKQFVYPEFISAPEKKAHYRLSLVFFGSEIQFTDWRNGMSRVK
jgi:hypothetical protein